MLAAMSSPATRSRGVTVIELMTVLVVLGIVITLVAPSMRGMIARHRVQAVQDDLLTDLQLARSETVRRSGGSTSVAVTFGGNAQVSCYTLHTMAALGVNCDCTRGAGSACLPAAGVEEIKTQQMTRATGVSMAASSPSGNRLTFAPPQGLVTPNDMVIDVQDAISGQLRTSVSGLGVPLVCSPDGSMRGVNACQ
jgi:prepilin-type N-terminal cleavage/methylation domain-containing protein